MTSLKSNKMADYSQSLTSSHILLQTKTKTYKVMWYRTETLLYLYNNKHQNL